MKRSRHASVYLVAGLTALICAHAGGREAHAAVFSVNSTADGVDAVPGDGVCATILKVCTLRAAVMETNALAGLDTIRLSFSSLPHMLTIPPTSPAGSEEGDAAVGDLDITDALFILPSVTSIAATVDGGHLDRRCAAVICNLVRGTRGLSYECGQGSSCAVFHSRRHPGIRFRARRAGLAHVRTPRGTSKPTS